MRGGTVSVCLVCRLGVGTGGREREDTIVMFCSPPFPFSYVFCASWTYRTGIPWSGLVWFWSSGLARFFLFCCWFVLMKRKKEMEQSEKFGHGGLASRHGRHGR